MQVYIKKGLIFTVTLALFCASGCQETSSQKPSKNEPGNARARIIASENFKLKERVTALESIVEQQEETIASCEQEKKAAFEQAAKAVADIMDEFAKCKKENAELKANLKP